MNNVPSRPEITEDDIKECHELIDQLVELHNQTNPTHGERSEADKEAKALLALNKVGRISAILTEWAENQLFGSYYHLAQSKNGWIDATTVNQHENELMWYSQDLPEDVFSDNRHLQSERLAIGKILHHTFGRYGRMGWRLSLEDSLYALNEGQVDWLLTPINTSQKGDAYDLQNLKWAAIKHLYILLGKGWKKTAAENYVATECGTNFETIKKWEKRAIKERDKDKEILNGIYSASMFIEYGLKNNIFETNQDIYRLALDLQRTTPEKDTASLWLSSSMIACLQLEEKYPLTTLKERLVEAGLRTS